LPKLDAESPLIPAFGNIATNRQPGVLAALAAPGIAIARDAVIVTDTATVVTVATQTAAKAGSRRRLRYRSTPFTSLDDKFPEAQITLGAVIVANEVLCGQEG
jgi:hypothetical protein